MRKGKIAAQVAHAAMKVFFDRIEEIYPDARMEKPYKVLIEDITPEMKEWIEGAFTKVVVSVQSEDDIYRLANEASNLGIPHSVIVDNGFTEFHGNKTTTCIALGPDDSSKIDQLTKELPLL